MGTRDDQTLIESCSCGATFHMTGHTYPPGYSAARGVPELVEVWRKTHLHEFPTRDTAEKPTVKAWLERNH